ncbi:MAG: hypothetical protein QW220_00215 [Candidatus Bathyarchaeia archaeon]
MEFLLPSKVSKIELLTQLLPIHPVPERHDYSIRIVTPREALS